MPSNALAVLALLIAAGCAGSQEIGRRDGTAEHAISCGYFGWYLCYEKANELCPGRYKVLSETTGLSPKELRIACPEAK